MLLSIYILKPIFIYLFFSSFIYLYNFDSHDAAMDLASCTHPEGHYRLWASLFSSRQCTDWTAVLTVCLIAIYIVQARYSAPRLSSYCVHGFVKRCRVKAVHCWSRETKTEITHFAQLNLILMPSSRIICWFILLRLTRNNAVESFTVVIVGESSKVMQFKIIRFMQSGREMYLGSNVFRDDVGTRRASTDLTRDRQPVLFWFIDVNNRTLFVLPFSAFQARGCRPAWHGEHTGQEQRRQYPLLCILSHTHTPTCTYAHVALHAFAYTSIV